MVAFAHKTEAAEPDFGPADPIQEVKRQAQAVLARRLRDVPHGSSRTAGRCWCGARRSRSSPTWRGWSSTRRRAPSGGSRACTARSSACKADPSLDGQRARGQLSVFVGTLLVADVNLTIRVDSAGPAHAPPHETDRQQARPYRKIFASYSHRDNAIVEQIGMLAELMGDKFMRDCTELRSGEVWNDRLMELIEEADVFQLFWSTNSITSPFVRREWEHALSLGRTSFVRPCYWEEPLPARPEEDLPPETLAAPALPPTGVRHWEPRPRGVAARPSPRGRCSPNRRLGHRRLRPLHRQRPHPGHCRRRRPPVRPRPHGPRAAPVRTRRPPPSRAPSRMARLLPKAMAGMTSIVVVAAALLVGLGAGGRPPADVAGPAAPITTHDSPSEPAFSPDLPPPPMLDVEPTPPAIASPPPLGHAPLTTAPIGVEPSIVDAVSNVAMISVAGGAPDTARVSAAVADAARNAVIGGDLGA